MLKVGSLMLLMVLCCSLVQAKIVDRLSVNHVGQLVDGSGRQVLLRGFNSVLKEAPYYAPQMLNETRIDLMKQWGFKVVRLGIIWYAAMPTENTFNDTYIDQLANIVDLLGQKDIYVILDMHQDGLSSRYGTTYEAIPTWLIEKFPKVNRFLRWPWPLKPFPQDDWFESYLTYECQSTFQNIYSNTSNALGYWSDFWVHIAQRFKNNPAVLGYELINEPFAGNIYTNPLRGLPGYAGYHNLLPTYDYLVSRIRAVDQETLIFYEPVTWGVFSASTSTWFGTGFDRVPGQYEDDKAYKKSVLSYHYYCWILQTADPSTIFPYWKRVVCDEIMMSEVFKASKASVDLTGGARFLTEFGLCAPDGKPNTINTVECNTVMRLADENFQSWTYWDSQFFDQAGNPQLTQLKAFSRAYPVATCGQPKKLFFNETSGDFLFEFHALMPADESSSRSSDIPKGYPLLDLFIPEAIHYNHTQYEITPTPSWLTYNLIADSASTYRFISDRPTRADTLISVRITSKV